MSRSDSAINAPLRLASMTRRQTSTVGPSPRSIAASSTTQTASTEDRSGVDTSDSKKALISAATLRRWAMLAGDRRCSVPCMLISMRLHVGFAARTSPDERIALARLVELQDAAGRLGVKVLICRRHLAELARGNAVSFRAEEQQRHHRVPREFERLGQDQQHFAVPIEQRVIDHIGWQRGQKRKADRDLVDLMRSRVFGDALLIQVA